MAAFNGTRIDRNTAMSSRKLRPMTTAMKNGRRWPSTLAKSSVTAANPPTYTFNPELAVAVGMTCPRSSCNRCEVASS